MIRNFLQLTTSSRSIWVYREGRSRIFLPGGRFVPSHIICHPMLRILYYDSQINAAEYPTIFAMALDYLPIQATSVPCERVFSAAALTDTPRRNRMKPELMEALQMTKFSIRRERLNIMSFWNTPETLMQTLTEGDSSAAIMGPDAEASERAIEAVIIED